jgi:hypothetical protein
MLIIFLLFNKTGLITHFLTLLKQKNSFLRAPGIDNKIVGEILTPVNIMVHSHQTSIFRCQTFFFIGQVSIFMGAGACVVLLGSFFPYKLLLGFAVLRHFKAI